MRCLTLRHPAALSQLRRELTYQSSQEGTHYYRCPTHGRLILPPNGIIQMDDPDDSDVMVFGGTAGFVLGWIVYVPAESPLMEAISTLGVSEQAEAHACDQDDAEGHERQKPHAFVDGVQGKPRLYRFRYTRLSAVRH